MVMLLRGSLPSVSARLLAGCRHRGKRKSRLRRPTSANHDIVAVQLLASADFTNNFILHAVRRIRGSDLSAESAFWATLWAKQHGLVRVNPCCLIVEFAHLSIAAKKCLCKWSLANWCDPMIILDTEHPRNALNPLVNPELVVAKVVKLRGRRR